MEGACDFALIPMRRLTDLAVQKAGDCVRPGSAHKGGDTSNDFLLASMAIPDLMPVGYLLPE